MAESSYYFNFVNDGSGNYTAVARRGGTASSGGTALSVPWVENANSGTGDTTSKLILTAIEACKRAAANDRAAGN